MKPKVLAVDDEGAILALLDASLSEEGYDVLTAGTAAEFRKLNAENQIDVFLIDVGLSDGNGFSLVKELRLMSRAGIIMLTGRASETDQVVGLEIGADDYVTKPFRIRELAARVNAVYRRTSARSEQAVATTEPASAQASAPAVDYSFDGYRLSTSARRLWGADGREIVLTTAEFDLLSALLRRRGQVLDRDQLMNAMKGRDWESYDRAMMVWSAGCGTSFRPRTRQHISSARFTASDTLSPADLAWHRRAKAGESFALTHSCRYGRIFAAVGAQC